MAPATPRMLLSNSIWGRGEGGQGQMSEDSAPLRPRMGPGGCEEGVSRPGQGGWHGQC